MQFVISQSVFEKHPKLTVGVVIATGIDNTGEHPNITEQLRKEEENIKGSMNFDTFREHPHIASLQEVHRSFDNNPNKFPPSAQALVKRILKGSQLPSINPIVDMYNVISLRYIVCAGAEDTDVCQGDIQLTYADGTESFLPLGENVQDPPAQGELVYKDDVDVICRKLNWREGDRTKITESTKDAVLVVEGFPPLSKEKLEKALHELSAMVRQYCHAETRIELLTRENTQCSVRT